MTHLTDEQIAAIALGEPHTPGGDGREHLDGCRRCRAELRAVEQALAAAAALEVPERGEDYGARVWAALEPRLSFHPAAPPRRSLTAWVAAAAVVLAVAGAFLAGRWSRPAPDTPSVVAGTVAPEAVRERIVLAALGDHLGQAERTLLALVNQGGNGHVDISAEQTWARDLLEANRLYRQAVGGSASPALAALLDDLEPVLLEIANSPSELTTDEFLALRDRIEERSLLFKVRATGADVRARERQFIRQGESQS